MVWTIEFRDRVEYREGPSGEPEVLVQISAGNEAKTLPFSLDSGSADTIVNGEDLSELGFVPADIDTSSGDIKKFRSASGSSVDGYPFLLDELQLVGTSVCHGPLFVFGSLTPIARNLLGRSSFFSAMIVAFYDKRATVFLDSLQDRPFGQPVILEGGSTA